jgi:hypothetical protein
MSDITQDSADPILEALGEQLAARGERFELVVIGGSALLALGLVERATRDVDIVALRSGDHAPRVRAPRGVRRSPRTSELRCAAVDEGGPGKHEADLRALAPTEAELVEAARWSRSHDPSGAYADQLRRALQFLGVTDVDPST